MDVRLKNTLQRLERLTSVSHHHGFSVWAVLFAKIRFLTEFVVRLFLRTGRKLGSLADLKRLRGSLQGEYAFVLANGPSATLVSQSLMSTLRSKAKVRIFAVNAFLNSELASWLTPDFLVLSDPYYLGVLRSISGDEAMPLHDEALASKLRHYEGTIFVPREWSFRGIHSSLRAKVVFFEDIPALCLKRGTSPTWPRPYISLTSLKALSIALYMRPEKVVVLGFDNSTFTGLQVDTQNRLKLAPAHHPGSETFRVRRDVTNFFLEGTSDFFFDLSSIFWFTKRYFSSPKILNLDEDSLTDAWDKVTLNHVLETGLEDSI